MSVYFGRTKVVGNQLPANTQSKIDVIHTSGNKEKFLNEQGEYIQNKWIGLKADYESLKAAGQIKENITYITIDDDLSTDIITLLADKAQRGHNHNRNDVDGLNPILKDMTQKISSLTSAMTYKGEKPSKADVLTILDPNIGDIWIATDPDKGNVKYQYLNTNSGWIELAPAEIVGRDFITDPIDIETGSTGNLPTSRLTGNLTSDRVTGFSTVASTGNYDDLRNKPIAFSPDLMIDMLLLKDKCSNDDAFRVIWDISSKVDMNPAIEPIINTLGSIDIGDVYWGGVLTSNGKIYCIPNGANNIGVIDISNNTFSTFGDIEGGNGKYLGGVLAPNGKIYCIPYNATNIGVIDPDTDTFSTFGYIEGNSKYAGAILGPTGKIYCIPRTSTNIGVIDPDTDTFSTFGDIEGGSKYTGGVLASNGKIYCVPYVATEILCIDTSNNTFSTFGTIEGGSKYNSGVLGPNGKIYCIPYNATNIGVIDTSNSTFSTFGTIEGNGKYNCGALAPNGKIYCTPFNATNIGVIDTSNNTFSTIGNLEGSSKYAGATLAPNGKIYCTPFNATNILCIDTQQYEPWRDETYLSPFMNKL